jgi:hypothetical protein
MDRWAAILEERFELPTLISSQRTNIELVRKSAQDLHWYFRIASISLKVPAGHRCGREILI